MPTIGESHIVKSYDDELKKLQDALSRMGGLAERQMSDALDALDRRDDDLASHTMHGDHLIDEGEHYVNEQTIRLLALRAPLADDLRKVITSLKAAGELERIGDLAANIAKRALALNQNQPVTPMRSLLRMGKLVQELLAEALYAFINGDADRAISVRNRDQEVDDLYSSLFREILTYMMEDPRTITTCSHLMFIAKNLERIGDHATNISEMTYFLVTGQTLHNERPKRDTSIQ